MKFLDELFAFFFGFFLKIEDYICPIDKEKEIEREKSEREAEKGIL